MTKKYININLNYNVYIFIFSFQEKTHECPECQRTFRHKGNLIRHMALHDPESTEQVIHCTVILLDWTFKKWGHSDFGY